MAGGDWGLPTTDIQSKNNFFASFFTWTHAGNPFGLRQVTSASVLFNGLIWLLTLVGISSVFLAKLFLVFVYALAGSNMSLYLRTKSVKPVVAFLGGLLYITTPIFFNYSLMGWIFVLLTLALLPLFVVAVEKYLETGKFKYGFFATLVFSIAVLQSQTLIWYPLVFIMLVFSNSTDWSEFRQGIKKFLIVMVEFLLLNCYWLLPLLFLPDKAIFDSSLVSSIISQGTSARLTVENVFRLWGSLFNYQFESSFPIILLPATYIMPMLALLAGFFYKKRKNATIFLFVLYLVPLIMFLLPRQILAAIPFSALIRDVARFAVLSSFGVVALAAFSLDSLELSERVQKGAMVICLILLFLNISPFWLGRLYNYNRGDADFKFRLYDWPADYHDLENKLALEADDQKAIFWPFGGNASSIKDLRFNGAYREFQDVSAGFSSVPGLIATSDKSQGISGDIVAQISEAIKTADFDSLDQLIGRTNITFLIVRRDLVAPADSSLQFAKYLERLVAEGKASNYQTSENILAIRLRKTNAEVTPTVGQFSVADVVPEVLHSPMFAGSNKFVGSLGRSDLLKVGPLFSVIPTNFVLIFDDQNKKPVESTKNTKILPFIGSKQVEDALVLKQNVSFDDLGINLKPQFLTFTSEEESGNLYFKPDEKNFDHQFSLNGEIVTKQGQMVDDLYVVSGIVLKQGLNTISDTLMAPIAMVPAQSLISSEVPTVQYKKLSPTKFELTLTGAPKDFSINFQESFNDYWTIYDQSNPSNRFKIAPISVSSNHLVGNDYSNIFSFQNNDKKSLNLIIEFWPQRLYLLLIYVSVGSFLVFLIKTFKNAK